MIPECRTDYVTNSFNIMCRLAELISRGKVMRIWSTLCYLKNNMLNFALHISLYIFNTVHVYNACHSSFMFTSITLYGFFFLLTLFFIPFIFTLKKSTHPCIYSILIDFISLLYSMRLDANLILQPFYYIF